LSPTSPTDLISLFMLGFLGTGHCIGMCGPLVVALPGQFDNWRAHLIYNLGRLATYSTVGGLLGLAGSGLSRIAIQQAASPMAWIARVQVGISIFSAAFLLLFGLTRLGLLREPRWMASAAPQRIPGYRSAVRGVFDRKTLWWLLVMGLMLGLLPCGLSYAAFARALAADSGWSGLLMTFLFGLGTLPGLVLVGTGSTPFFRRYRTQTELISGLIMIGMAVKLLADAGLRSF
jgi:sulfite exporter TauE/SafE